MPLTLTIVLDDADLDYFVSRYNRDAGQKITVDTVLQNEALKQCICTDMATGWINKLDSSEERASTYDLYSEFFEEPQIPVSRLDVP